MLGLKSISGRWRFRIRQPASRKMKISWPKMRVWTAPMMAVAAVIARIRSAAQKSASAVDGFDQIAVSRSSQRAIVTCSYCSTATMTGEVVIRPLLLRSMM